MKKWIRNLAVGLALLSIAGMMPTMIGCNKRPDPKANPDFNAENLDPSKVQMKPIGGPGDSAKTPKK